MAIYDATLIKGEDGPKRTLVIEADTFGAALQQLTAGHVPDGWRIEDLTARAAARLGVGLEQS